MDLFALGVPSESNHPGGVDSCPEIIQENTSSARIDFAHSRVIANDSPTGIDSLLKFTFIPSPSD